MNLLPAHAAMAHEVRVELDSCRSGACSISGQTFADLDQRQRIIEELLHRHHAGEGDALQALWHELYDEVHRMARSVLSREGARRPIDTTVLVHELYLKLGGSSFENRAHFFGSLVRLMGQIIVDSVRRRERSGRRERAVSIAEGAFSLNPTALGLESSEGGEVAVAVTRALDELEAISPRAASVAWLRFVGGLSVEQVATCLEVSDRTVKGDWRFARAWLHRQLTSNGVKPRERGKGASDVEP